jgi:hypothetical protein
MTTDKIAVRAGWILINTSHAQGGIHYARTPKSARAINGGAGAETTHETVKTVDDVQACAAVDAIVKRAHYLLRRSAAWSVLGWVVSDPTILERVRAEVDGLQAEAVRVNLAARACGSARRAWISLVAAEVDLATPDAAREVARTIREVLGGLAEAIRAGDLKAYHAPSIKAKHLDSLAVGITGEAVRNALDCLKRARADVKTRIDAGESPESAGRAQDLEPVDAAISWFTDDGGITGDLTSNADPTGPQVEV